MCPRTGCQVGEFWMTCPASRQARQMPRCPESALCGVNTHLPSASSVEAGPGPAEGLAGVSHR